MMAYGCIEESREAFERVGNKVVAELRRVGLNASWGGTARPPASMASQDGSPR